MGFNGLILMCYKLSKPSGFAILHIFFIFSATRKLCSLKSDLIQYGMKVFITVVGMSESWYTIQSCGYRIISRNISKPRISILNLGHRNLSSKADLYADVSLVNNVSFRGKTRYREVGTNQKGIENNFIGHFLLF